MSDLDQLIKTHFPKSQICLEKGHAKGVISYGLEEADDRYYTIKFERCSRCGMPISGDEYVGYEEEKIAREKGLL